MAFLEDLTLGLAPTLVEGVAGIFGAKSNRQYNEQMWLMNNEYNSMSSQVNRAIEAGINPNALFGSGMSSATSQPLSVTPQTDPVGQVSSLMGSLTQNALTLADVENKQLESDQKKVDLTFSKMTFDTRVKSLENMTESQHAQILKIFSDIGMNDFNKEMQTNTYYWFAQKSEAEINLMLEQLNLLRNQSLDILKGIEVKDAQIKDLNSSAQLKDRQTQFYDVQEQGVEADIALKGAQTSFIGEQEESVDLDNQLKEITKKFSDITDIPLGATESEALFALWKEGRFGDFIRRLMVIAVENGAETSLPKLQDLFNKLIENNQKAGYDLLKSIFTR